MLEVSRREQPLHFHALLADPATPLAERTAQLLHRDLQRWTRRYLRPVARVVSRVAVWLIVSLKRTLPFQFSSHDLLDRLGAWFQRRCVSREGGELLRRHFIVETRLLQFVARNCALPDVTVPDLLPTTFRHLLGHAVIRHDVKCLSADHRCRGAAACSGTLQARAARVARLFDAGRARHRARHAVFPPHQSRPRYGAVSHEHLVRAANVGRHV